MSSKASKPPPPAPPPATPDASSQFATEARSNERQRSRLAKGRRSSMLTNEYQLSPNAQNKKRLLG